jgi:hypothetical protein
MTSTIAGGEAFDGGGGDAEYCHCTLRWTRLMDYLQLLFSLFNSPSVFRRFFWGSAWATPRFLDTRSGCRRRLLTIWRCDFIFWHMAATIGLLRRHLGGDVYGVGNGSVSGFIGQK